MRSEAHCPNVLTVYYFKTSSGGIPAPSGSIPCRRSVTSVDGRLRRKPNFCGVHSLRLYGVIGWLMVPRGAKGHCGCVGYPQSDEREVKDMRAAKVTQSGAGEEIET